MPNRCGRRRYGSRFNPSKKMKDFEKIGFVNLERKLTAPKRH